MKKIMYLEDNAYLNYRTVKLLNTNLTEDNLSNEYEAVGYYRIDLANDFIDEYADNIGCIIVDLNMNDEWLGEYQRETNGGQFSGWVWLKYEVFNKLPDVPIIIYSGYIDYFKKYLYNKTERLEIESRNIQLINKGGNRNQGFQGLYNAIKKALSL